MIKRLLPTIKRTLIRIAPKLEAILLLAAFLLFLPDILMRCWELSDAYPSWSGFFEYLPIILMLYVALKVSIGLFIPVIDFVFNYLFPKQEVR